MVLGEQRVNACELVEEWFYFENNFNFISKEFVVYGVEGQAKRPVVGAGGRSIVVQGAEVVLLDSALVRAPVVRYSQGQVAGVVD